MQTQQGIKNKKGEHQEAKGERNPKCNQMMKKEKEYSELSAD